GVAQNFTHVSTGGGAALELIAGKKLVAIEKLEALKK
ncbi:phosphoglycerate kinase, partial [Candidatus Woesearchaeota archaeon]|nr:phosphoglycerate kinase [Candidatus Woesearchaeota archaeon]